MVGVKGAFFDGDSAQRHEVEVTLTPLGIQFGGETVDRRLWRIQDLHLPARLPGGGVRLTSSEAPKAQLVIEVPGFHDELVRLVPRFGSRLERWRRHRLEIGVVVASVLLIVGCFLALPYLSRPLARIAPDRWVEALGDMVERQMIGQHRICAAPEGIAALQALLANFHIGERYDRPISVKVVDRSMINAFAAPGGRVFLMRGLLDKAESPDEVAGVLAHELGHVVEHHPTANAIRQVGAVGLLKLVLGDGGQVMKALGQGGALLVLLSYTRQDEAAADRIALQLLQRAGVDAAGFAAFFARLDSIRASKGNADIELLSTHPNTAERLALARKSAGHGRQPALAEDQWLALKRICAAAPAAQGRGH